MSWSCYPPPCNWLNSASSFLFAAAIDWLTFPKSAKFSLVSASSCSAERLWRSAVSRRARPSSRAFCIAAALRSAETLKRSRRSRMLKMIKGDVGMFPPPRRMRIRLGPGGVVDVEGLSLRLLSRLSLLPLLATVEEGNAERMRMRMRKEDAEVFPPLRLMRIRLGPVGTGDVEGMLLRLLSRVPPLPLLLTVEEGNVDFPRRMSSPTYSPSQSSRMRMSPSGAVDVEGLSLRLLQRVPPLPLLSTMEEGSAEVPRRKIRIRKRRLRKLNARVIADGLIL